MSSARTATLFQGGNVQITDGHFTVVGGDKHTHIHYHGSRNSLTALLGAISNFRKIQQDTLAKSPGTVVWLLECDKFQLFIDVDGSLKTLWGFGMRTSRLSSFTLFTPILIWILRIAAGAGKTILAYVFLCLTDLYL